MNHLPIYDLNYLNPIWKLNLSSILENEENKLLFLVREHLTEFLKANHFISMEVWFSEEDETQSETLEFTFKNENVDKIWRMFVYDDENENAFIGLGLPGRKDLAIIGDILYRFYIENK